MTLTDEAWCWYPGGQIKQFISLPTQSVLSSTTTSNKSSESKGSSNKSLFGLELGFQFQFQIKCSFWALPDLKKSIIHQKVKIWLFNFSSVWKLFLEFLLSLTDLVFVVGVLPEWCLPWSMSWSVYMSTSSTSSPATSSGSSMSLFYKHDSYLMSFKVPIMTIGNTIILDWQLNCLLTHLSALSFQLIQSQ